MSVVYLVAFTSLAIQTPGLFGDNGILPAKLTVEEDARSFSDLVFRQPTLLRLLPKIGFDVATAVDFLSLGGAILSFVAVVSRDQRNTVVFGALWIFYLSVFQIGQTFMSFQWDAFLMETGFLTILMAPLNFFGLYDATWHHAHDRTVLWMIRWTLFRAVFATGVSKVIGPDCQTWLSLNGVKDFVETQYLPTPISWYIHQFPDWFLQLSTAGVLACQLLLSLFIVSPIRNHKIVAFYSVLLASISVALTGNHGYYSLLLLTTALSLVDDDWLNGWTIKPGKGCQAVRRTADYVLEMGGWTIPVKQTISSISYGILVMGVALIFGLAFKAGPLRHVLSAINFGDSFDYFVTSVVVLSSLLGALSLAWQIISTTVGSYRTRRYHRFRQYSEIVSCVVIGLITATLFVLSLVPHSSLTSRTSELLPSTVRDVHTWTVKQYHITNYYQSSLSGGCDDETNGGRPEIIIEGTDDLEQGWHEYNFRFKPSVSGRLSFIFPHQPRLDSQMWFASHRSYQQNPWILTLFYRLLTDQSNVSPLMGSGEPFEWKYIRASLYNYRFTSSNKDNPRYSEIDWWTREYVGEYTPIVSLQEPSFVEFIQRASITQQKEDEDDETAPSMTLTAVKAAVNCVRSLIANQSANASLLCLVLVVAGSLLTLLDPNIDLFTVDPAAAAAGQPPPPPARRNGAAAAAVGPTDRNCFK
jgi:hypothetical protein